METQKCEFFSKSWKSTKLNSVHTPSFRMPRKNRPGFVNISLTLVIDTPTERSSRVLQLIWEPKIWFFFKKVRNWIWLVLKNWNQHSSRFHLYVDIGDASSSLWGSTFSLVNSFACAPVCPYVFIYNPTVCYAHLCPEIKQYPLNKGDVIKIHHLMVFYVRKWNSLIFVINLLTLSCMSFFLRF